MTTYPENPIPCIHCGAPTILFSDGKARGHKTGKVKPDGKPEWHRQPQSAVALAQPAHVAAPGSGQPAPANQPSAAPGADEQPLRDPTRVSIERQVAAKAAAEVVSAAIAKGMSPEEFNTWAGKALALAARMGAVIETGEYSVPGSGSTPKTEAKGAP